MDRRALALERREAYVRHQQAQPKDGCYEWHIRLEVRLERRGTDDASFDKNWSDEGKEYGSLFFTRILVLPFSPRQRIALTWDDGTENYADRWLLQDLSFNIPGMYYEADVCVDDVQSDMAKDIADGDKGEWNNVGWMEHKLELLIEGGWKFVATGGFTSSILEERLSRTLLAKQEEMAKDKVEA